MSNIPAAIGILSLQPSRDRTQPVTCASHASSERVRDRLETSLLLPMAQVVLTYCSLASLSSHLVSLSFMSGNTQCCSLAALSRTISAANLSPWRALVFSNTHLLLSNRSFEGCLSRLSFTGSPWRSLNCSVLASAASDTRRVFALFV